MITMTSPSFSIAGAMISELLLQDRIMVNDDKKQIVAVINDERTGDELLDGLQGRDFTVDHERLDAVVAQILGGSPSHTVTEYSVAVL